MQAYKSFCSTVLTDEYIPLEEIILEVHAS